MKAIRLLIVIACIAGTVWITVLTNACVTFLIGGLLTIVIAYGIGFYDKDMDGPIID